MKKLLLSLTALFTLGVNVLVADIIAVYSWHALGGEGSTKPYTWVDLYNSNNYTYNPQTDKFVSNDLFRTEGLTRTLVVADTFSEITLKPLVDASFEESIYQSTQDVYVNGKPAKVFTYYHPADMEGVFFSHYNSIPYSTYDVSRFLRYP